MKTRLLFASAYRSLTHHKGRSLLTLLGIIIGISAIIATLAIGYGAEEKIRSEIIAFGDNYMMVWGYNYFGQEGATKSKKRQKYKSVTIEDIEAFKKQCPEIKTISPTYFTNNIISYQGLNVNCSIKGGNKDFLKILGRKIKQGSFYTTHHISKNSRVIILGSQTAKELFKSANPIGQVVSIKNIQFTVIGVAAASTRSRFDHRDPNFDCFAPYTTARKCFNLSPMPNQIHAICISSKTLDMMSGLVKKIIKILRARHNLEIEEPNDFSVIDQQGMLKAAEASSGTLSIFLLIIAAISLLVGGIGVMNIMLVSVSERTKEIGIRMALGAPSKTILKQFLIESVLLCFVGGIIGIILGSVAPYVAHYFANFPVVTKTHPVIIAFFTIFFIGLIFGYYPAWKASRLNPVDALKED